MQTYLKVLNLSGRCLRFSQFSQLSFMQYMGLCLLSSPIPLIIVRIRILYLIIIIKSDLSIFHCLGLDHETMVCAVYIFILWYLKSISNKDTAFKEMLIFGKSWNVTWFQLKAYKMFAKWALESWINQCERVLAFNPLRAGPVYVWDPKLVITVLTDGLAPNGAKPSVNTVQTEKLDRFLPICQVMNDCTSSLWNGWRHSKWPTKSRGTSSVNCHVLNRFMILITV